MVVAGDVGARHYVPEDLCPRACQRPCRPPSVSGLGLPSTRGSLPPPPHPPPTPRQDNGNSTEPDGNNAYCCSDTGVVCARRQKTHAVTVRPQSSIAGVTRNGILQVESGGSQTSYTRLSEIWQLTEARHKAVPTHRTGQILRLHTGSRCPTKETRPATNCPSRQRSCARRSEPEAGGANLPQPPVNCRAAVGAVCGAQRIC